MDYVVGSVAALISGNVTPNRPKVLKRALTPMKHQPSPNVTPKSELGIDRSIFLSPTMQKKKAIVKKSPKRIFENPDLDATNESDGYSTISSPKADKVKKHLKDELDVDNDITKNILSPKSPKNKFNKSVASPPKETLKMSADDPAADEIQTSNERTPKKKKKKLSLICESAVNDKHMGVEMPVEKSTPKKKKKSSICTFDSIETQTTEAVKESSLEKVPNVNKKLKNKLITLSKDSSLRTDNTIPINKEIDAQAKTKIKRKKKTLKNMPVNLVKQSKTDDNTEEERPQCVNEDKSNYINPNAITNQDTDSEHDSDDNIQSENEENNRAVLDTGPESSDDDEETDKNVKKNNNEEVKEHVQTEDEVNRTLFVGNVPFSSKCKKEMKRLFSKYGEIETVRIRTVPVKDGRVTPKLAVIKNELHPDRSTVNVYIKYVQPSSVNDALVENNTIHKEHHLRVARSDVTGSEHDPRCSVFVGNIPFALEDEGLRAKFAKCGEIESVRIVRDRKTNAGKGFGYVNFASKDGVELALALTEEDLTIKNRILRVKRCTQATTNQIGKHQKPGRPQNYQRRPQNYQGRPQNYQGRPQNYQGRPQNHQGRPQNHQGGPQNQNKRFINHRQANNIDTQFNRFGRNQFGNDRFSNRNQTANDGNSDGAYRRIMEKRKLEGGEGPPQKRQKHLNQPNKEKKPRKEFVGMTADKKKFQKRKLNKDQKKKKALSEILTKQRQ